MEPVEIFLALPTAKDVWVSIAQMYYDASDESHIYKLRSNFTRINQVSHHVFVYFAELKAV